jgi:signal transduction histidine kinase
MAWTHLALFSVGLGLGWLAGRVSSRLTAPLQPGASSAEGTEEEGTVPSLSSLSPVLPSGEAIVPLDQQLQRAQLAGQMAKEMAQFKAGFLARTSHELRSPINSVISLHQLILADLAEDPDEEREFIAQASQSARKMLELLDQLIKISKADHGTETLKLQPLSLEDVLAELELFTQLQARNRNVSLQIEPADPDVTVLADSAWLRQVLLSLVDLPLAVMQSGTVRLTSHADRTTQHLHIWIDDQRPASFWSEPVDLLSVLNQTTATEAHSKAELLKLGQFDRPSAGLTLLMAQTLLELMGGRLEILAAPTPDQPDPSTEEPLTRIQCTLPLAP